MFSHHGRTLSTSWMRLPSGPPTRINLASTAPTGPSPQLAMSSPRSGKSPPGRGRQKVVTDPLEQVGFVSKGDTKLLDPKIQESYYNKLVDRYMQFCTDYSKSLDGAFGSLPRNPSDDPTTNPPAPQSSKPSDTRTGTPKPVRRDTKDSMLSVDPGARELSILLLSMRKLREGILATSSKTSVAFSQRVHIFCIRVGILAEHPPSYYPPLERLVKHLHTQTHPLSSSNLHEFTTYLILDYACRQVNLQAACALRTESKVRFGYQNSLVNRLLSALVHDNWVAFWKARGDADGYTKTLVDWVVDRLRKRALKAIGRAYLTIDVNYLIKCCTGHKDGYTWEHLVEQDGVGWTREGDKVLIKIRKPNFAPTKKAA